VRGVHLARAGTIEAIEAGKRELVEALPPDGWAVLNADDARVAAMATHTRARALTYGYASHAAVRAEDVAARGSEGMGFRIVSPAGSETIAIPTLGRHGVHNALAAAAVAIAAGLSLAEIVRGLERSRCRTAPSCCVPGLDDPRRFVQRLARRHGGGSISRRPVRPPLRGARRDLELGDPARRAPLSAPRRGVADRSWSLGGAAAIARGHRSRTDVDRVTKAIATRRWRSPVGAARWRHHPREGSRGAALTCSQPVGAGVGEARA
jgi:hypothetical protein